MITNVQGDLFDNKFSIDFTQLNILTGDNGIGKTTILEGIKRNKFNISTSTPIVRNEIAFYKGAYFDMHDLHEAMDMLYEYYKLSGNTPQLQTFKSTIRDILKKDVKLSKGIFVDGNGVDILPHQLSNGEARLFTILSQAFTSGATETNLFLLDNPEDGLSILWQRKLIEWLFILNPNMQVFIATHSATLFYLNYENCVIDLTYLKKEK